MLLYSCCSIAVLIFLLYIQCMTFSKHHRLQLVCWVTLQNRVAVISLLAMNAIVLRLVMWRAYN